MPAPSTKRLTAAARIVQLASGRWPAALAHAVTLADDGYPGGGTGPSGKGAISDPTAAAVMRRTTGTGPGYRLGDEVQRAEELIAMIAEAGHDLLGICDRLMPAPTTTASWRCSGGAGLDGHLDWGRPTCENVADGRPSYAGLCVACYRRRRHWETERAAA